MGGPHSTHPHSMVSSAPVTSTVRSSVFTHEHPRLLSLAARLHQRHANRSRYINNGGILSGQTSYFPLATERTPGGARRIPFAS